MHKNNLGKIIKELRKKKNLTQQELAYDLCSISQLYRIEKGLHFPSAFLIEGFSKRLCENLFKYNFFSNCNYPVYFFDFFDNLEHLRLKRQYKSILSLINLISHNPKYKYDINLPNIKQLLGWYKGISISNNQNKFVSVDYYFDLLRLTNNFSLSNDINFKTLTIYEIKIVCSIGITYLKLEKYNLAKEIFFLIIENINYLDSDTSFPLLCEIYYNISKLFYIERDYSKAIEYANLGISLCIYNYFSYFLADLFYILGKCYEYLNDTKNAIENYNKFIYLYDIIGHDSSSLAHKTYLINKFTPSIKLIKNNSL